jgi:hypothetical protein
MIVELLFAAENRFTMTDICYKRQYTMIAALIKK